MKIELIKEEVYNRPHPWFKIEVDGAFIIGSFSEEEMNKKFEEIKANPDIIKTINTILWSEVI